MNDQMSLSESFHGGESGSIPLGSANIFNYERFCVPRLHGSRMFIGRIHYPASKERTYPKPRWEMPGFLLEERPPA
jgi:hypothetical protein